MSLSEESSYSEESSSIRAASSSRAARVQAAATSISIHLPSGCSTLASHRHSLPKSMLTTRQVVLMQSNQRAKRMDALHFGLVFVVSFPPASTAGCSATVAKAVPAAKLPNRRCRFRLKEVFAAATEKPVVQEQVQMIEQGKVCTSEAVRICQLQAI